MPTKESQNLQRYDEKEHTLTQCPHYPFLVEIIANSLSLSVNPLADKAVENWVDHSFTQSSDQRPASLFFVAFSVQFPGPQIVTPPKRSLVYLGGCVGHAGWCAESLLTDKPQRELLKQPLHLHTVPEKFREMDA